MKGAYLYILKCSDGSYYTGSTINLEQRISEHKNGEGSKHTKSRLPLKLVFVEEFHSIETAFLKEKQIKGWSRKKKEALIKGDFNSLVKFSNKN